MIRSLFIWAILCGFGGLTTAVKVSVYYESLCPYSVAFLVTQFYPAYNTILREKIQIDLIPFGKANITNSWTGSLDFNCQHGERECYGNKVQSCVLAHYPLETSTEYVVCAMGSGDASLDANLQKCAADTKISWTSLQACLDSGQAEELLVQNGDRTYAVRPRITGIPTIVFNDVYSPYLHSMAISNFQNVIELLSEEEACKGCHLNGANTVTRSGMYVLGLPLLIIVLQKTLFK